MISDGDIVGKYVTHIASLGKVINFLSSSTGFLVVIVLPMLLFFIYQVYNLIMISIRLKKAIAVESAKEQEQFKSQAEEELEKARKLLEEAEAMKKEAAKQLQKAKDTNKEE